MAIVSRMNASARRTSQPVWAVIFAALISVCVMWIGLAGSALAAAADEAESQLREASRQLAEKNLDGALASVTASLAGRPTTDAYQLRAVIQSCAGRHAA